jgi:CDP-diacylglycerol---glycerol-3-phosphate 3-phosphatidyltransferase
MGLALVLTVITGAAYVSKAVQLRRTSERTAMKRRRRAAAESK